MMSNGTSGILAVKRWRTGAVDRKEWLLVVRKFKV
jgi:hypothetical protein